jgi:hypothetical protein
MLDCCVAQLVLKAVAKVTNDSNVLDLLRQQTIAADV